MYLNTAKKIFVRVKSVYKKNQINLKNMISQVKLKFLLE